MKNLLTLSLVVLVAIVAISCGQQEEKSEMQNESASFVYPTFAAAEKAAAENGQYMVLDFYTDW